MDPFLWQNGVMRDLGTFGGAFGATKWMNDRGEVAGFSDLPGDNTSHPFLWNGRKMLDLGTLGGNSGVANWVNNHGAVVGSADVLGSQAHHGFLWNDGSMHDLPPTDGAPCANANVINDRGQVVGNETDCHGDALNAMLWENGSAVDLNTVVAPTSVHLNEAFYISPEGEIACQGTLPNGDSHVVLLVPIPAAARDGFAPARHALVHRRKVRQPTVIHDPGDRFNTLSERIGIAQRGPSPLAKALR
jgi:probable HAF family extracellular repeat protein